MVEKRPKHAIFVGCAGWALPKELAGKFPAEGTHLARYAGRFSAVEINSSFYRPHKPATYARWASSVSENFRFAVKIPKAATHERRLVDADEVLDRFLGEAKQLGEKLGPLLVQLPPSLAFNAVAEGRLGSGSGHFAGDPLRGRRLAIHRRQIKGQAEAALPENSAWTGHQFHFAEAANGTRRVANPRTHHLPRTFANRQGIFAALHGTTSRRGD